MSLDLLVFGPHPDDIEIGLGASVAKHVAMGLEVGLCDLTQGEMGSNGTVEDRRREAEAAARVLGVAWRENLQWPDGGITDAPEFIRSAVEFIRHCQPKTIAIPYWKDRHPDHVAASDVLTRAAFQSKLRRYETRGEVWRADTAVTVPGAGTVVSPGGLLALSSNIGRHRDDTFTAVPELGLTVGWHIAPRLRLHAGYTLLYLFDTARAADQIDLAVNPGLLSPPTGPLVPARPRFELQESTIWMQGLTLGAAFQF